MAASYPDIAYRKQHAFCGSIKCAIRRLRFEALDVDPRQPDAKNVSRLLEIFKLEGCRRLEPENHVPALISRTFLNGPEGSAGDRTRGQDVELLRWEPTDDLVCLHGRHRIEAAKTYLHPDEMWWIVDLYSDDLGTVEVDELRQEYSNAKNFYDGDIYRHLRRATLTNDIPAKQRWLSKLSMIKRRDVVLLEKRAARDPQSKHLQTALDELLPYTGLWPALQIGTFHRLLSLRCPEEMTRYLRRIKTTWEHIVGEDKDLLQHLNAETVAALEGRCPRRANEDQDLLRQQEGGIFPTVNYPQKQGIWTRICQINYIIPSIHTFLEDTKLLEPCAKVLKKLLPTACKTSVYREYYKLHNGQTCWQLQTNEIRSDRRTEVSSDVVHKNAYRQLWLYAMRHFPEMIGQTLRKDPARPKPTVPGIELVWWYRLTALAMDCGYTGIDQAYVEREKADYTMAQVFLEQVRPSQLYGASAGGILQQMVGILSGNSQETTQFNADTADTYGLRCGSDVASRCGVPFERAFRKDQRALFLVHIDRSPHQDEREFIGSFTVKQDVFHSFFGDPEEPVDSGSHSDPPEPQYDSPELPYDPGDSFSSTRPPDPLSAETETEILGHSQPDSVPTLGPAPDTVPTATVNESATPPLYSRADAIRRIRTGDTSANPNSHSGSLTVLQQVSPDGFNLEMIDRTDRYALATVMKEGYDYLSPEDNRSKRLRLTSPVTLPTDAIIIGTQKQDTNGIREAIENSDEL